MGCAQSRIENEEAVSRCKERKILMKEALAARNAFAAGHTGYTMALKNTGAALSDYGEGEAENNHDQHLHSAFGTVSEAAAIDATLPPPPPPLPNYSPSPLKRAVSMPELSPVKTPVGLSIPKVIEEDERDDKDELMRRRNGGGAREEEPTPPRTPAMNAVPPPPPDAKGMSWDYFFMVENMAGTMLTEEDEIKGEKNEDEGEVFHEMGNVGGDAGEESGGVEPKTPQKTAENEDEELVKKAKQLTHANTAPLPEVRRGVIEPSINLMQILNVIDDHFLKASESAQELTKMLEANRMHYHSNFADNGGHIDHSARVMRVITWNKSIRGMHNADDKKDVFDAEEYETHATVLDKLLAWEKKLYDEVKAGELMKHEYQRKVALLNKQKKRSASTESLEKTKAAVSHLHTRYIVDMQSMDSTVSEVNHIRDDQLYPKLVALVDGMAKMWNDMCMQHNSQLKMVTDLKSIDISQAPKETSKHHHERTIQLWNEIQGWHSQFEKLVTHEKQYIQALNSWLKLNLIPIESSLKEKISSPPRPQHPPIQALLHSWHDSLEKLPHELAKSAISSFAAVIKTIILHQEEEMKLKEKCEETQKEYSRKHQAFQDWYQKYMQRRTPPDETDPEKGDEANPKDPISEKQFVVESLKKKLEEEVEAHQRHCVQVREKSLGSLKLRLPELFRALTDYTHACSDAYQRLKAITQSQSVNGVSS